MPKKYIQVKTQVINGGSQMIVVFSDITRLHQIQKETQKMK
jgi:hypothetical protein